jgi:hypothetical protein
MTVTDVSIPVRRLNINLPSRRSPNKEYFLKGPIPLRWLHKASALPGKACTLGILLLWFHGMDPNKPIKVTKKSLEEFSISEDAYRDGLKRLEEAGLVSVSRRLGQRAVIQLIGAELKNRKFEETVKGTSR